MPDTMVPSVEVLGVDSVDVAHAKRQNAINRFYEQVVVIAHKRIGIAEPVEALHRLFKQSKECCPVDIVFKYLHPGISPRRHMINGPRIFYSQWSGHIRTLHYPI
jgi:hypothetical protein